jgi:hypothetical protein
MKKNLEQIDRYQKQMEKDKLILERKKNMFIEEIKKTKKEDLISKKPTKLTLWQKIKKVLMG